MGKSVLSVERVLWDIEEKIATVSPLLASILDYEQCLRDCLPVVNGHRFRREFRFSDTAKFFSELPSALAEELCAFCVDSLDAYLLKCLGERPSPQTHLIQLVDPKTLLIFEL